jgi:hypothetical protein
MKKYVLLAVAALVGLAAVSCKSEEKEAEDALNIVGTTINVGKDAASPVISFKANKAWTATSDSPWIVPAQTSGEAGSVNLTLAVAENTTWEQRSGKVTVAVGLVKTDFTVVQGTESVLETGIVIEVSPEAQDIEIPVKSNLQYTVTPDAASTWIKVVSIKSAPTEKMVTVHVDANTELAPREGTFTLTAPGYSQQYVVFQNAAWTPAVLGNAVYIGNSQDIYDNETWSINLHQQYIVNLATADGDEITLALNKKGKLDGDVFKFYPVDKIPAATYEIDATGKKDDNTFSIKSSTGKEKYYTHIVTDKREVLVYDGTVTVAEENGAYTITAILIDAAGEQHSYSYAGQLDMATDFCGGGGEVNWKNTFDTYFTTKANGWSVYFYLPRMNPEVKTEVAQASFSFYSAAGEVDLNDLPAGTYTFGTAETDPDLKYKNGIAKADAGLLSSVSISLYDAKGSLKYTDVTTDATVLTVSTNEDGTKNFKYAATVKPYTYDTDYNKVYEDPVQVNLDIDVPLDKATDEQTHPYDDKDDVFTTLDGAFGTQYIGYWYSKYIGANAPQTAPEDRKEAIPGTECNVFSFGSNSYFNNCWEMMIAVIANADWVFEKNFANRFCSTPIQDGTYTFGTTAQIGAMIPLMYGASSRCYVTNTYTGTTYYPVSGSVTLNKGTISLDLTCKATEASLAGRPKSPATIHLTGGTDFTCYYHQDYSAVKRVKLLSINSPVPLVD